MSYPTDEPKWLRRTTFVVAILVSLLIPAILIGQTGCARGTQDEAGQAKGDGSGKAEDSDATGGEEAPEEEEREEPKQGPSASISIAAIGNVILHDGVMESGRLTSRGYDFSHLFSHVKDEMGTADIRIANQETPIAGGGYGYSGYPSFNGPFEVADAEADAGINLITKATNHTFDQGYDGLSAELSLWRDLHPEVAVIGAADPDGDGVAPAGGCSPAGPYILEKSGLRVAFLNYTEVLNESIDPVRDPAAIALASDRPIVADIGWARSIGQADAVVVLMHWGDEYAEEPSVSERRWASFLSSLGVDIIIGTHPHVMQPVETIDDGAGNETLVFWSIGNFTSVQTDARNMLGLMAKATITKDDHGVRVSSYAAIPTVTHVAEGQAFTTYLLRDYSDELAMQNLVNRTSQEQLTMAWCQSHCSRILGGQYDEQRACLSWGDGGDAFGSDTDNALGTIGAQDMANRSLLDEDPHDGISD